MADKLPEKPNNPAPDPGEDDLDDLDDVLDEFAATKLDTPTTLPTGSGPGRPHASQSAAPDGEDDEFANQLQAEMAQLLAAPELQQQLEDFVKGLSDTTASTSGQPDGGDATNSSKTEQSFQETIRRTMERMKESGDQASTAAASHDSDDILAQMLKEMENGGFGGDGTDEDFSQILMGMMEQLTNKEILYEPMKELNNKFPTWLAEHREGVDPGDLQRYEEQHLLVREIVQRFEKPGYSDANAADREYIVQRMQKMQAAGSPPPDLVGNMNAAQEALGEIDAGCPTQ